MSGVKLDVQWCPSDPNKFITWGTELYLYEVQSHKNVEAPWIKLSSTTGANLLATNSSHQYVKCVDIYPQPGSDVLLAIGQANGKVVLTTFGPSKFDALGIFGKDFVPRHPRQCNAVAWNPIDSNLIVAGLNKDRSDHSILLWDVMKCPFSNENSSSRLNNSNSNSVSTSHHHHVTPTMEFSRPIMEIGMAEAAHSLCWFKTQPRTMMVGMNMKQLKMFDLRDPMKVVNSTITKAVLGCTIDPNNDKLLASFFDNQICVWDLRNFDKPVLTSSQNKVIQKIAWCPTRNNLLSSLQRDNASIHLHDIQHVVIGNDDIEQTMLERSIIPSTSNYLSSFSWHPNHENRLLSIATMSGVISDYTVSERMTLNWAPSSNLVWTHGKKTFKLINNRDHIFNNIGDISEKMRSRSLRGYGLKPELWKNGELADDPMVESLWDWLYLSKCLVEEGNLKAVGHKHPGVKSVLKVDGIGIPVTSTSELLPWSDSVNINSTASVKVYRSEDRDGALYLCGWRFDKDIPPLKLFLERLELDNSFSKAACIAVFNLRIKLGIETLNRGAEKTNNQHLKMVAMALAGFCDERNSLWRQFCHMTLKDLTDPYLRAMFAFLTSEDSYDLVLNESGVAIDDRVAFACMYLSDTKLAEYLKQLTVSLTEEGNLAGLLLTGSTSEGLNVLQKYLDRTGDVQTVSVIAIRAFPPQLVKEMAVQVWIDSYRNLLNAWHLWNERALFDIELNSTNSGEKPKQQVYVSCNYCGKSISAFMQAASRGRAPFGRIGSTTNKLKLSSCPNCRKPLPRCAICLMHMGTASSCFEYSGRNEEDNKMVELSSWFTWCQSCRHGGHAAHMTIWFKDHAECPVTGCSCKCFLIDKC